MNSTPVSNSALDENAPAHNGTLAHDAPGIHSIYRKLFSSEEVASLEAAYSLAATHGSLNEGAVAREEGVSYNPRPARIAHILWKETDWKDPQLFCVAMLSCCAPDAALHLEDTFPKETRLCRPVWQQLALPAEGVPQSVTDLTLCHIIDQARHLHMTSLKQAERAAFVHYVTDEVLICAPPANESTLSRKLHHWASTFAQAAVNKA